MKRWKLVVKHTFDGQEKVSEQSFDELCDIDDYMEGGPDWNTLDQAVLTYNHKEPTS